MPIFQWLTGLKTRLQNVLIYSKNVLIRRSSGPAGNAFRNCQGTKDRRHPQDAAPPSSGVDHGHVCRLLLGGQMARAGAAWSCTSPMQMSPKWASNVVHAGSCRPCRRSHRVHTGDRPRHVRTALGSNTSRKARQQTPGQIANEQWLTTRSSAPMRER